MKVVIPGGSGQVGTVLARAFHARGDDVVVLSRSPAVRPWRSVAWDGETLGAWAGEFDGADAVINLAGVSVNCRYTPANRTRIRESRLASTRVVGQAIAQARQPPPVWLHASTATIYAHTFGPPHDEATGVIGGQEPGVPETWRFSIDVATAWERVADEAPIPAATRLVKLRSAMIMSPDRGGVFDTLLRVVRFGLGGAAGSGRQFVSWVHDEDFIRAVDWILSRKHLAGAINVAAPGALPYAEFMRALRRASGVRIGLPATRWMLEIGTFFLRTQTELILKSRRVTSGILLKDGFEFRYPEWPQASADLVRRWRSRAEGQ